MARRTVNGCKMDSFASNEPTPLDILIVAEGLRPTDAAPSVLIWGCGAWPLPGQSRSPDGPEPGVDPRQTERHTIPVCGGCRGAIRRRHYCLVCNRPKGTLVGRELANEAGPYIEVARLDAAGVFQGNKLRKAVQSVAAKLKGGLGKAASG